MATTIPVALEVTSASSGTASWNNMTVRQSVLDSTNQNYLRTFQINGNMVILTRGQYIAGLSLADLAAILYGVVPQLTWPPKITLQPVSQTEPSGSTADFTMTASAELPITYQWQLSTDSGANFTNLTEGGIYSGTTASILGISDVTGLDSNQYRCVATNASGSTNTTAAILTVTGP